MHSKNSEIKVTWKGWISLIFLVVILSGIFKDSEGVMAAFDFTNLSGSFGAIYENINFTGKGGAGAREGFMVGLTLVPAVMLFSGILTVFQNLGAFDASNKVFQPLLKPDRRSVV